MKGKRKIALLLCMAMVFTLISPGQIQAKAKKPGLSKKKVEITAGKKATIKVKRGKKAAKVSWKTSKKSVAKIVKKTKKGNKARATIKGVRAGKAKITAVYKLGKKKTKLTCKVTVKAKDSGTDKKPTGSPTGNTSGKPSGSPSGSPSTAPTQKPSDSPSGSPSTVPSTDPSTVPSTDSSTAPSVDPSTEPSTDPSTLPSEDPSASPSATPVDETHDVVNISKDNVAFAETETEEYKDGTVEVGLSSSSSGMGICFYLNDEHTSVDMAKYKNLKIEYETEKAYEMAVSLKNNIPASAASDYWAGADDKKLPNVGSEQYTTFSKGTGTYTLSLSSVTAAAQGVFIKYNTYNKEDTADPVATITIKSIKLEKDPSYVAPTATPEPTATPVVQDLKIDLTEANLAYNASKAADVSFADGKMTIDTKTGGGLCSVGLYINSDKSSVPWNAYDAIKINASTESGEQVKWMLRFVGGEITSPDCSTDRGGGKELARDTVLADSASDAIVRNDLMDVVTTDTWDANVLQISNRSSSTAVKYTVNSITLLKKCPDAEEDININITEDNIAFATSRTEATITEGTLNVKMSQSQAEIGLYLKPDKSSVDLYDYYSLDIMRKDGKKVSSMASNFVNTVKNSTSSKGGGSNVGTEYIKTGINVGCWKANPIADYKITTSGKNACAVYLKTRMSGGEEFAIDGIRLRKNKYANDD